MIKTILVPATGNDTDLLSFRTALQVARQFGAHIDVLHVRLDPIEIAVAIAAESGGGVLVEGVIEQLEKDTATREANSKRLFEEFCAGEKLTLLDAPTPDAKPAASAQWHVETGDEARWMTGYGMAADLIIAGRDDNGGITARSMLEAALLETGRPLLIPDGVVPATVIGGTVAIGWKPTPQAARAVAAAMPFLAHAKQVIVITVEEEDGSADADRLVRSLAWHGIQASAERLAPDGRDAAEILLSAAAEKASFLVMGGYGHSRVREWVFGGFTQRVLEQAPLPVLMAH
jgi:nucleotide-binding universal stress UspA family protein